MTTILQKETGMRFQLSGAQGQLCFEGDRSFVKTLLSRWLIPGTCIVVHDSDEGVSFRLSGPLDIENAKLGFRVLRQDLEEGLRSQYFAERVLEKWGMTAEEKLNCVRRRLTNEESRTLEMLKLRSEFIEERRIAYLVRMIRRMHYGMCRSLPVWIDTPIGVEKRIGIIKKNMHDAWYVLGNVGYVEL